MYGKRSTSLRPKTIVPPIMEVRIKGHGIVGTTGDQREGDDDDQEEIFPGAGDCDDEHDEFRDSEQHRQQRRGTWNRMAPESRTMPQILTHTRLKNRLRKEKENVRKGRKNLNVRHDGWPMTGGEDSDSEDWSQTDYGSDADNLGRYNEDGTERDDVNAAEDGDASGVGARHDVDAEEAADFDDDGDGRSNADAGQDAEPKAKSQYCCDA